MHISEERLANLIDEHGTIMRYYQGTMCPCLVTGKGQPDPACDCNGGFRYAEPVEHLVLRTSVSMRGLHVEIARILQGGCNITVPYVLPAQDEEGNIVNYDACALWTRVTIGDVFSELNRSRRDRDILVRGTRDALRSFDVEEIISVSTQTAEYVEGDDYSLPSDKSEINWKTGRGPATGAPYTVEFRSKVQFVVWDDMTKHRGSEDEKLPHRLRCRLRQYVKFDANPVDDLRTLPEGVS